MKYLIFIAIFFVHLSCTDNSGKAIKTKELTEEQKRKYYLERFTDYNGQKSTIVDSVTNFEIFIDTYYPDLQAKNKYNQFIYDLEEPYIDTTKIDPSLHWFRLTVSPTFSKPYCIVLNRTSNSSIITAKMTNGQGIYHTGKLAMQLESQFKDTLYDSILRKLENLDFWDMPSYSSECGIGFDGDTWTFELIENGKYHLVHRREPEDCKDSVTRKLAVIGIRLREMSRLDKVIKVLGENRTGL